jgi:hypothetical protein
MLLGEPFSQTAEKRLLAKSLIDTPGAARRWLQLKYDRSLCGTVQPLCSMQPPPPPRTHYGAYM